MSVARRAASATRALAQNSTARVSFNSARLLAARVKAFRFVSSSARVFTARVAALRFDSSSA